MPDTTAAESSTPVAPLVTSYARAVLAISLAQEIGSAYRGDWADFDGRSLRAQMDELTEVARGDMTAEQYRRMNDLCPFGYGHWLQYCSDCDERAAAV